LRRWSTNRRSPTEMRRIAPVFQQYGLTVSAPLLPGHGTTPADLNRQRLEDWLDHVHASLSDLQRTCPTVFIGGLSLGSLLALHVASRTAAPGLGVVHRAIDCLGLDCMKLLK
jgi:carboxylesterase